MEKFKKLLPALLLILFEIVVGILLLVNPKEFTIAVFIIFGVVLIVCALVLLIRYLKERKNAEKAYADAQKKAKKDGKASAAELPKVNVLLLIAAIATFIFGALFVFGSKVLADWTKLLVIFFGAIMIIKGIFKIAEYVSLRKEGWSVSVLRLIVGILSIAAGVVMMIFNESIRDALYTVAAVVLLIEAGLDIVTLILGFRMTKNLEVTAKVIEKAKDDDSYNLDDFAK